jgi:hypothetical protein
MYELRTLGEMTFVYHPQIGVIPEDELNRHYLDYIVWLFEGNTPEQVNVQVEGNN